MSEAAVCKVPCARTDQRLHRRTGNGSDGVQLGHDGFHRSSVHCQRWTLRNWLGTLLLLLKSFAIRIVLYVGFFAMAMMWSIYAGTGISNTDPKQIPSPLSEDLGN